MPRPLFPSLTRRLGSLPEPWFAAFAAVAAFAAYFAMYGFRKPFTAGIFEGTFPGTEVTLKTAYVLSQVIGYVISKYIGVKVCSETTGMRRGVLLVSFIVFAEASLVLFAVLPPAWRTLAMFANALPLGMIWGLIVSYLEGRRCSDFVLAGLCGSFIVASGAVKDIGLWLMNDFGIPEIWMPAATGALFLPVFFLAVGGLAHLPPPGPADEALRVRRVPMDKHSRRAFLRRFLPGLALLFALYFLLTAYRDFRDNYGIEIFTGLGYGVHDAGLFTRTEIPVAIGALAALAAINWIRDNRRALTVMFLIMIGGMAIMFISTYLARAGWISGLSWMIATGLGTYLTYVPFNAVFFERLMAATGSVGTAVFGIQLADSIGYSGSALVQLFKDLGQNDMTRLVFFQDFSLLLGGAGVISLTVCAAYFHHRARPMPLAIDSRPEHSK